MAKKPDIESEWLTPTQLTALTGWTPARCTDIRGDLPPSAIRRRGRVVLVHGPTFFAAAWDAAAGGSGEAAEEYRIQRTRLARVQADEAEGLVVRVADIRPVLERATQQLRACAINIGKLWPEAARELVAAIDVVVAELDTDAIPEDGA